jgi:hypothetical protein
MPPMNAMSALGASPWAHSVTGKVLSHFESSRDDLGALDELTERKLVST